MLEVLQGLQRCRDNMERAVLATIVEVEGAAFRREGARCLILQTGDIIGTLSGGCVGECRVAHSVRRGEIVRHRPLLRRMGSGGVYYGEMDFRSERSAPISFLLNTLSMR